MPSRAFARAPSTTALILHGTADRATVPAGSVQVHRDADSRDMTLKLYEGDHHDLLADYGKEDLIADMIA